MRAIVQASASPSCMPGEPECIAESWMYFEAIELQRFIQNQYDLMCQEV